MLNIPLFLLLSVITICMGMAVIAYQDFTKREIDEMIIVSPALGMGFLAIYDYHTAIISIFMLLVLALIGYLFYNYGMIAQGDVITLPLISTVIYALPYISVAIAFVALVHIFYIVMRNGWKLKRSVTVEQAKLDTKWIPDSIDGIKLEGSPESAYDKLNEWKNMGSIVEENYGFPLAGYIALGAIIGVILWFLL